jgi:hypothetical protein
LAPNIDFPRLLIVGRATQVGVVGGRDIGRRFGERESVELGFQDVMQTFVGVDLGG